MNLKKTVKFIAAYLCSWLVLLLVMGLPLSLIEKTDSIPEKRLVIYMCLLFAGAACIAPVLLKADARFQSFVARKKENEKTQLALRVKEHHVALGRNLNKAVKKNDYGSIISDNRHMVVNEFLLSIGHKQTYLTRKETVAFLYSLVETYSGSSKRETKGSE